MFAENATKPSGTCTNDSGISAQPINPTGGTGGTSGTSGLGVTLGSIGGALLVAAMGIF